MPGSALPAGPKSQIGRIIVVDQAGTIRAVSQSSHEFPSGGNLNDSRFQSGMNYLALCEEIPGEVRDVARAVAQGLRQVLEGQLSEFALEYAYRHTGELQWSRLMVTRMAGEMSGWAVIAHLDITYRRRVEERSRKLAMAVEQSPISIVITDTAGRVEYVNPHLSVVSGFAAAEVVGQNPRIWKGPETPTGVHQDLWATISSGRLWEGDLQNRRKDGEAFWEHVKIAPLRNDDGVITHYVAVKEDVTGRRRAEAELRASETRLRTLFETVNLIALGLDADGKVEYVNPYFLQLTGYSRDEVIGANWFEKFVRPERLPDVAQAFDIVLKQGVPIHYRNAILTKAGQPRLISWHNTVLRDETGAATGTLSLGEDVTEHAQLEDQFRQAQKMEAVGRLAGGVAHDFNNHLTVIMSYSEMLLADLSPADPRRTDLAEIHDAAAGAASLTRQLLAFSRQQVIEARNLDLSELVTSSSKMLKRLIGEDIELVVQTSPSPLIVRIDPGQLDQVIMNLAVNSRDAMPNGGRLTIETVDVTLDESHTATHQPAIPGRFAMLALSDTGIGMDEQTRQRIFEPFFTTKVAGKGTGLGLATVYGIVKQSRGFIWVYSEPGKGTTFKIYLPLAVGVTADARIEQDIAGIPRGAETILLVEDSAAVRSVARQILERQGYTILEARTGKIALDMVCDSVDRIHLLLTDVIMPEMSGRQLAERFHEHCPDAKVLFMSGYTDDAVVLHGVLEEGLAYLQKPFSPESLARKVRQVLDSV